MRALHSPHSALHDPPTFFRRGKLIPAPEGALRYHTLRRAVEEAGHPLSEAGDLGLAPIAAVHDADYLSFLQSAWARRAELDAGAEELLTTQFARVQMHRRSTGLINQLGYHTADTSTPIRADTWDAVYASAQVAIAAADAAREHGVAYALCRPPGHHAYADCAGGFCYLNNTAIAAQRLQEATGARVAILDVDVHHGNGTQGIFYRRGDVMTVSIHAETSNYFPLFAGYRDEFGEGEGEGANFNLPLAHGAGDAEVLAALDIALDSVAAFTPAALVVALGLDAATEDPLGVFNVTDKGFAEIARRIAVLSLPTALIQEGGYVCPALPVNLKAFLKGFEAGRG
ncbi:MAG TPA: histone deacetylase family protein [Candidatus Binatia bacterium]|nr:histone deacetylase family protein [Candidatus Binatia bacterium]